MGGETYFTQSGPSSLEDLLHRLLGVDGRTAAQRHRDVDGTERSHLHHRPRRSPFLPNMASPQGGSPYPKPAPRAGGVPRADEAPPKTPPLQKTPRPHPPRTANKRGPPRRRTTTTPS